MISSNLMKTFTHSVQLVRRFNAKKLLTQLTSQEHPKLRAVGYALYESLNNKVSSEEQEFINVIESRRSYLLSLNKKKIPIIDYGAGNVNSSRTSDEMGKGIHSMSTVANICKGSRDSFWGTILFKLIRKLEPLSCVELGSCVGISASYQASALKINGKGNLKTLEGSPEIAKLAQETLDSLNLQNASVVTGPFHKTLQSVLESSKPVDFFFNDGHHDYNAVMNYFDLALPNLSDEAIIIIDDISWSQGMRKAWTEIKENKGVAVSIDLQKMGIALIEKGWEVKKSFKIPL